MNKYEIKERLRKAKWATKKAGGKWGNKEMMEVCKGIILMRNPTPKPENSGISLLEDKSQANSLKNILGDLSKVIKAKK